MRYTLNIFLSLNLKLQLFNSLLLITFFVVVGRCARNIEPLLSNGNNVNYSITYIFQQNGFDLNENEQQWIPYEYEYGRANTNANANANMNDHINLCIEYIHCLL